MKITAVKGFAIQGGERNQFVVKVETDAGIAGIGEGGMAGRERAMQGMIDHFERFLVGMDPRRIEHIWQRLYRSNYFEGGKIVGAAISAIDIALWDILGQSLGVPVYQLLGGACRDRIGCFATTSAELTGPEVVEEAKSLVAQGWRHIRLGPGMPPGESDETTYEPMESVAAAAHWVRQVREAVGPEVNLSIDFHHRLSPAEAAIFCQQIDGVHLWFLEEPIRAQSPKAYAQLRSMTPVPLAIGEEFSNKWEFVPFIEDGLLNYARVDISNVGGLTEAKKVAGWCEAHYIDMMPHNPLGPVTTAATIHFCAAINNFDRMEYLHELANRFPHDLFPTMPELSGDGFALPTAPGLGVTFNEEALEAHRFEYWEAPHYHRRDGAVQNW